LPEPCSSGSRAARFVARAIYNTVVLGSRYTEARSDNFDIYLPLWLARRNKMIFGTLFAIGELFVLGMWMSS
jgi:hypothetical protein